MKKEYEKPELEIIQFETEDVMTSSGGIDNLGSYNPDWLNNSK